MRSYKLLLFAVVLPGILAVAIRAAFAERSELVRVEVIHRGDVEAEEVAEVVEVALAAKLGSATTDRCDHSRAEEARLDAAGISRLRVEAGSGSLTVHGRAGLDEVVVRSMMCASSGELLAGLSTGVERRGDDASVSTEYPGSGGFGHRYARIDLEVDVPLGMAADLEDGSGPIVVEGTGDTRISDGSGEIEAGGLNGPLEIRDASGGIRLRDIAGDVDVVDGSGEVEVADVDGDVRLTDGSGGIEVFDVTGSVEIRADGSGSIEVTEVGGDFVVRADGSGSIRHDRVRGRVQIPRKR